MHVSSRPSLWRRLRNAAYWFITALDDVLVEKIWFRLRRGDVRGASRVLAELAVGWWGCTATLAAVIVLLIALVAFP
jgi:hypothetical protein